MCLYSAFFFFFLCLKAHAFYLYILLIFCMSIEEFLVDTSSFFLFQVAALCTPPFCLFCAPLQLLPLIVLMLPGGFFTKLMYPCVITSKYEILLETILSGAGYPIIPNILSEIVVRYMRHQVKSDKFT